MPDPRSNQKPCPCTALLYRPFRALLLPAPVPTAARGLKNFALRADFPTMYDFLIGTILFRKIGGAHGIASLRRGANSHLYLRIHGRAPLAGSALDRHSDIYRISVCCSASLARTHSSYSRREHCRLLLRALRRKRQRNTGSIRRSATTRRQRTVSVRPKS